jgi:hypothetical protein
LGKRLIVVIVLANLGNVFDVGMRLDGHSQTSFSGRFLRIRAIFYCFAEKIEGLSGAVILELF